MNHKNEGCCCLEWNYSIKNYRQMISSSILWIQEIFFHIQCVREPKDRKKNIDIGDEFTFAKWSLVHCSIYSFFAWTI